MNIDAISLQYVQTVIKTAQLADMDNVIIEPDCVRAINLARNAVIIHTENVPSMPFGSIGLTRLHQYESRVNLITSLGDVAVEATTDTSPSNGQQFVRSLTFKNRKAKVEYRCANPTTMKLPRNIPDEFCFPVRITPEMIRILKQCKDAMKASTFFLTGDQTNGINLIVQNENGDTFTYQVSDLFDSLNDETSFKFMYETKLAVGLLEASPNASCVISKRGVWRLPINGLTTYIIPLKG